MWTREEEEEEEVERGGGSETYGSMLTGVASLMADSTGGVMSQLSVRSTHTHETHTDVELIMHATRQCNIRLNAGRVQSFD